MEEFESYFENLNFHFNNWHDILENENIDINSKSSYFLSPGNNGSCELTDQNVQLLPREDVSLYGIIPKMEKRSFSSCKECKLVFNPKDILLHKNCSLKVKNQHVSHFKKKVKTKKKSPIPLPPLFSTGQEVATPLEELNTTELRPNTMFVVYANELPQIDAIASPMLAKPTPMIEDVRNIPLPLPSALKLTMALENSDKTTASTNKASSSSHTSSNSYSGSESKRKKYFKRPDSNTTQCDIVEDTKGPCTRSIKYSNHSSENEPFHRNKKKDGYFSENNSQEIPVSVPIVYLSMSPVSDISPLQVNQEGDYVCLETPPQVTQYPHQMYFSIPYQMNVKMYKTKPKPCSVPLYGARKIGSAIVISKQKLVNQRKEILSAIDTNHKPDDRVPDENSPDVDSGGFEENSQVKF